MVQRRRRPSAKPSEKHDSAKQSEAAPNRNACSQVIDPDPFTLVTGTILALAGVAQIVSVAHQMWPARKGLSVSAKTFVGMLKDELHSTIRLVEKIERHLRELHSINEQPVLEAPVEFGSAPVALPADTFGEHERLIQELTYRIAGMNKATLSIIKYDGDFATRLGTDILSSFHDINERINRLRDGTNGEAIYGALFILREIERILMRIDSAN